MTESAQNTTPENRFANDIDNSETFCSWCLLEIMGHQRYAGRVTQQQIGGSAMVRIDVPPIETGIVTLPGFTKFFGTQSIFCITPCTEETARKAAASFRNVPYATFSAPMLPPPPRQQSFDDDEDDDRYED